MTGAPRRRRLLMLVSARADGQLRGQVASGLRPRPEYLVLEQKHGVELLDWSKLPGKPHRRSAPVSVLHVAFATARLSRYDAVFSDGEHLGLLLSQTAGRLPRARPHLMLGHHLSSARKRWLRPLVRGGRGLTRIVVHSQRQLELAVSDLEMPRAKLALVRYHADTNFWRPLDVREEPLVVAAGREHRDYATLAAALGELPITVMVASGSAHSPQATTSTWPSAWPRNFNVEVADYARLREMYGRASVVVVPLVQTEFQAGITVVLEAMAMGKAVVVTDTAGRSPAVQHGETGLIVPNADPQALREAVKDLMAHPGERARLGRNARESVLESFSLEAYAAELSRHLTAVADSADS